MFKALIVALAAVAAAVPTRPSSGDSVNQCANGELRCCNKEAVGQILPVEVLNPMCNPGLVSVVGVLEGNKCDLQTVCCNNVEQNGVVNVACTPIDVL